MKPAEGGVAGGSATRSFSRSPIAWSRCA